MKPAKGRKQPKRRRGTRAEGTNPRALGTNPRAKAEREAQAKRLAALPYSEYLKTLHWARKRKEALARWGGWCEGCGVRTATEVHHKTYARLGRERLSDLAPLCGVCHRAEHKDRRKHVAAIPPTKSVA